MAIIDIIGDEEAQALIDVLGVLFLTDNGYKTKGCLKYANRMKRLKNAMKRQKEKLHYREKLTEEGLTVWFELIKPDGKKIKSKALRFFASDKKLCAEGFSNAGVKEGNHDG